MSTPTNIRVLVPRVQRKVEGVVSDVWTLTDSQVKDLIADSLADIILYTGSIFGKTLDVAQVDTNGAPLEYTTSDMLTLPEQSVIAAQAALNFFFFKFAGLKVSETIADEASTWTYELSPSLLVAQLKTLQAERDKALEATMIDEGVMDSYVSYVATRDTMTARYIEPWVWGHPEGQGVGAGGLEGDFRFDELTSGGGDYNLGNAGP